MNKAREILDLIGEGKSYEEEKRKGKLKDYDDLLDQATKQEPKVQKTMHKILKGLMKKAGYSDKAIEDYTKSRGVTQLPYPLG